MCAPASYAPDRSFSPTQTFASKSLCYRPSIPSSKRHRLGPSCTSIDFVFTLGWCSFTPPRFVNDRANNKKIAPLLPSLSCKYSYPHLDGLEFILFLLLSCIVLKINFDRLGVGSLTFLAVSICSISRCATLPDQYRFPLFPYNSYPLEERKKRLLVSIQ